MRNNVRQTKKIRSETSCVRHIGGPLILLIEVRCVKESNTACAKLRVGNRQFSLFCCKFESIVLRRILLTTSNEDNMLTVELFGRHAVSSGMIRAVTEVHDRSRRSSILE